LNAKVQAAEGVVVSGKLSAQTVKLRAVRR